MPIDTAGPSLGSASRKLPRPTSASISRVAAREGTKSRRPTAAQRAAQRARTIAVNVPGPSAAQASLMLPASQLANAKGGGSGRGGGGGGGGAGGAAGGAAGTASAAAPFLDLNSIRSALAAISAAFDLQEGELTAQQEAARRAFGFLSEQFAEDRDQTLRATKGAAAGRGTLRSGLYLAETGRIGEAFAKQTAQAQAERDGRLRAIAGAITGIASQEKAHREQRARELAQEQVGTQEAIAKALKLV
jgi:hypothetical protein